jgi:hypothetical protein
VSTVVIPSGVLAGELEFAIAYVRACNPDRDLLGADRKLFAQALIDMLFERAGSGQSGMRVTSGETPEARPGTS